MSETKTRLSQNAFNSETRSKSSKSGLKTSLETKTNLEFYNTMVKKNICVKIPLHTNIWARKAELVRNYFPRRNNFCLCGSWLPSVSLAQWFLTK